MECVNLIAEVNSDDQQAPTPVTYYLTPGTSAFATPAVVDQAANRGEYRTSIGTAYTVIGSKLFSVQTNGALVTVGNIADRPSQVYMADNGLALVLVDGDQGWAVDLATNDFAEIIDASFYGADFVVFLDTFFVFNRPDTNQFYISLSTVDFSMLTGGTAFDPLDIAAKSGSADPIVAILTYQKQLWLIGTLTTEIWIGTGAADFYFQLVQGAYIDHGCIAQYTAANTDVIGIWLMQDRAGKNMVVKTSGYGVEDIGTPFLTNEFNSYVTTTDAIGFFFQLDDHAFYALVFPQANKSWLYELKTKQWARWAFLNVATGVLERHRANCAMFFNGMNLIGDYETGKIYTLRSDVYTDVSDDPDNPTPIRRIKTFLHMVGAEFERVTYNSFDADMEVGRQSPVIETTPLVFLSWSDDRGVTFGNPVGQSLGKGGEYDTVISWNRLGMARDRIFKLEWSEPIKTALNGGFATVKGHRT
jgi:hypothetical protein